MADFLLELLSEEIPARMQAKGQADLARLFTEQLDAAGLAAAAIETYATPRRLALIARNLPTETQAVREETKGPRTSAPPQALEGFLRKTGLSRDQLEERDGIFFAVVEKPGRSTASVLAEAIPAIIRAFPWPKSMRWGEASLETTSLRWVRPLQGIVALLGEEIVEVEIAGVGASPAKVGTGFASGDATNKLRSGAATVGHRFHHPGIITIGSANDYAEKLRACHVLIDPEERKAIIRDRAAALAAGAGVELIEDEGLVAENAGLTEWPVPLIGRFDPAFLEVPPEVIQLTARINQKYFVLSAPPRDGEGDQPKAGGGGSEPATAPPPSALRAATSPSRGGLAPYFICTANIEASDGGAAIVAGNERVLSARLSDAKFFWEQDLRVPLEKQAEKLSQIVFHEKLGTVADKVERVAKLARWLVEEGIVKSSPGRGGGEHAKHVPGEHADRAAAAQQPSAQPVEGAPGQAPAANPLHHSRAASGPPPRAGEDLAALAERAARLAKADLVTGMVGEFPELQGLIGGYLARAQGEPDEIADAIRDHYKPVGQGDEVPTAPVTVAVSLADKLDTLVAFFASDEKPTGSKDPFALRRAAIATIGILVAQNTRLSLRQVIEHATTLLAEQRTSDIDAEALDAAIEAMTSLLGRNAAEKMRERLKDVESPSAFHLWFSYFASEHFLLDFFADRLKVQQREAGVRHDLIDAVFALGGEDDLVRLLARVRALQAFVESPQGADLLAGYKRAANILKKEGWGQPPSPQRGEGRGEGERASSERPASEETPRAPDPLTQPSPPGGEGSKKTLSYTPLKEEADLIAALDSAEPRARAAVEAEDFEGAMAALASLRGPVDSFFDKVTVNDPDPAKRAARLDLLARMREAVHQVADFSRIEG